MIKYDTAYRLSETRFEHPAGTIVYRQNCYDYGISSDDTRITGVEHVTMTLRQDGGYPGFAVPVHVLEEVPKCVFCNIEENEPDRVIASNELAIAIFDGFPVSPGHALVFPRRHVESYFDLSAEDLEAIQELITIAAGKTKADGYNIGVNEGRAAGRTVDHVHFHVIPRYIGDVPDPRGGVRWVIKDKADYWSKK